jgi:predicted PurR-regulated permease PerM
MISQPDSTALKRISAFSSRSSMAVRLLAGLAIGALLYFAHAVFIPIALAVLFSLLLTLPVEALHRCGLPRSASAIVVLAVLASLIGGSVNLLWAPAQSWWASAPKTLMMIEKRSRPVARLVSQIEMLSSRAGQIGVAQPPSTASLTGTLMQSEVRESAPHEGIAVEILDQTRDALVGIVTVTILVLFLLTGGPPMLARMSAALAIDLQSTQTLRVINAVRIEVSRYYASIALINLGLGVSTALTMMFLGMPNPLLWGTVAAVLNFLPYVGSATTLILLTVVAFVTFNSLGHVAVVAVSYLALATIEGQVVQPLVVGRRLELNPIMVFLALWLGGWFWGVAGIVMAVPTLLSLKVVAQHSRLGGPLTEFLSPEKTTLAPVAAIVAQITSQSRRPDDRNGALTVRRKQSVQQH